VGSQEFRRSGSAHFRGDDTLQIGFEREFVDGGHGAVPAGHEHEITLKGLFLFPLPVEADADPDAEKRE